MYTYYLRLLFPPFQNFGCLGIVYLPFDFLFYFLITRLPLYLKFVLFWKIGIGSKENKKQNIFNVFFTNILKQEINWKQHNDFVFKK